MEEVPLAEFLYIRVVVLVMAGDINVCKNNKILSF